jgi:peptidoglycan/xylan/chitin deacetylase (PgdA/CDA1 family)
VADQLPAVEDQGAPGEPLKVIALVYHDIVRDGDWDSSGFPGRAAARYKMGRGQFAGHLAAIARIDGISPTTVDAVGPDSTRETALLLTFDDGGSSAFPLTAEMLEGYGWRGHFFVTVGRIGTAGFLQPGQIRALRGRGHVVGSHSYSHPRRMAQCSWQELMDEWRRSTDALSSILGEPVRTASLPGGYYSRRVAEAAAEAGITLLFSSEPTCVAQRVAGCRVLGRYDVRNHTAAAEVGAIAGGRVVPRLRRFMSWNAKKLPKMLGGDLYVRARTWLLR